MWVLANCCAMAAVQAIGLATAQSTWAAQIAIISFVWGIALGNTPQNLPLTVLGLVLLIFGIFILAYVSSKSDTNEKDEDEDDQLQIDEPLLNKETDGRLPNGADSKPAPKKSLALGFLFATGTGVFAGSVFVPLKLAPSKYRNGLQAIKFSFSQGVSTFPACLFWVPLLFWLLYLRYRFSKPDLLAEGAGPVSARVKSMAEWLPPHHFRKCFLPGFLSGVLWNMGNLGGTLASLPPLEAVGYTMAQSALLVACLWGVVYFKEIQGTTNLSMFASGAGFTLVGLVIAGYFGQAK
jgi:hypothetical protein